MRRRVLADSAADRGTHLGAVAPVHPAPHTRVAFLGMDLVDAGVATNRAAIAFERQRELIGVDPHRVEPQHARADRAVSRGIFGWDGVTMKGVHAGSGSVLELPSVSPARMAVTGRQNMYVYFASQQAINAFVTAARPMASKRAAVNRSIELARL